ncbi:hypothetical protein CLU79DRAFT_718117 [Phycomyces nitens]|nr:hypothetical protein CLU79DRAFT_718117 [Phycomyces nitens]
MVPPAGTDQSCSTSPNPSPPSPARTRRRAQHSGEEPPLVYDRMEHKRQRLLADGFDEHTIHLMLSPEQQHSHQRYSHTQTKYINWATEHSLNPFTPNPAHIVNFIAFGHSRY